MTGPNIKIIDVLYYYDAPQICWGVDKIGVDYLLLLTKNGSESYKYIATALSNDYKDALYSGRISINRVFKNPENDVIYNLNISDLNSFNSPSETIAPTDLLESQLPSENLFITDFIDVDEVREADYEFQRSGNKLITKLILNTPETIHNKIKPSALSDFVEQFPKTIKYLYRHYIKNNIGSSVESLLREDAYSLNVFAFDRGSFEVHFESESSMDLFGNLPIEYGFEELNELMDLINNESDEAVELFIRRLDSRSASAVTKLIKSTFSHNTSFEYSYKTPNNEFISKSISKEKATSTYNHLANIVTVEIDDEEYSFTGELIAADKSSNKWEILDSESEENIKGVVQEDVDIDLDGLTIGQVYSFRCKKYFSTKISTGITTTEYRLIEYQ